MYRMGLTMITDVPGALVELLFVRAVWDLPVAVDLPPADPPPDRGESARPRRPQLVVEWDALWGDALHNLDSARDEHSWGPRHGLDGVDLPVMPSWKATVIGQIEAFAAEYHHAPETLLRDEFSAAERHGLSRLVVLPVRGLFARPRGPNLVISTRTYLDPEHLRREVGVFAANLKRSRPPRPPTAPSTSIRPKRARWSQTPGPAEHSVPQTALGK
jgi:hypothetical protein